MVLEMRKREVVRAAWGDQAEVEGTIISLLLI